MKGIHMGKLVTFMGPTSQNDKSWKATEDVVALLNKANNTNTIEINSDGDVCLFGKNELLLQIGTGKSTAGEYLCAYLYYGDEEESSESIDFATYEEYIRHVYEMVNNVYNKKIKIVTYAVKWKYFGKQCYVLNDEESWSEYESFEINDTIFRIFLWKTYTREKIYDFRVGGI